MGPNFLRAKILPPENVKSSRPEQQKHHKTTATNTSLTTPHTPPTQRSLSTFSSPGSLLGKEEDAVIIELDPRYLSAGIEGESGPQCKLAFGPENRRRLGDHRSWLPDYNRRPEDLDEIWGRDYELWRNDVGDVDPGLLADVLERTVREAYNKHLLVDAGAGRMVLVLPSLVPHPVLETVFCTLFKRWRYASITLFPRPAMAVVSAGLRSGLVVDIGWEEVVITSISEYREVGTHRSTRAMKLLTRNFATILKQKIEAQPEARALGLNLDMVETALVRVITTLQDLDTPAAADHDTTLSAKQTEDEDRLPPRDAEIEIPLCSGSALCTLKLLQHELTTLLCTTLLGESEDAQSDDHEIPLPQLILKALLSLSPDLRGACLSRVIFIGSGSASTVLRRHILKQTESLIHEKTWTTVKGKHLNPHRTGLSELAQVRSGPADARHDVSIPAPEGSVEEKIQKQRAKVIGQPIVPAELREVRTLGPWAGASLLASLKIRGFVEIERDRFLSHGLSGASRDFEISVVPERRLNLGLSTAHKTSDRTGWTLGGWG